MRNLFTFTGKLPRRGVALMITVYQYTLSPDHGPLKVFYPYGCCMYKETCSQYSKRVVLEHGVVVGFWLAVRRILSCHPGREPEDKRLLECV